MGQMILAFLLALPVVSAGFLQIYILKRGWLLFLKEPIDGNKCLWSKRIFGSNKTWLGVVVMGSVSATVGTIIWGLNEQFRAMVNITSLTRAVIDFGAIGMMYSFGELPNSFLKRRLDIQPGTLPNNSRKIIFEVIDLTDGIVGVGFGYWIFLSIPVDIILWSMVMGTGIHFMANKLMIKLNLKVK